MNYVREKEIISIDKTLFFNEINISMIMSITLMSRDVEWNQLVHMNYVHKRIFTYHFSFNCRFLINVLKILKGMTFLSNIHVGISCTVLLWSIYLTLFMKGWVKEPILIFLLISLKITKWCIANTVIIKIHYVFILGEADNGRGCHQEVCPWRK